MLILNKLGCISAGSVLDQMAVVYFSQQLLVREEQEFKRSN